MEEIEKEKLMVFLIIIISSVLFFFFNLYAFYTITDKNIKETFTYTFYSYVTYLFISIFIMFKYIYNEIDLKFYPINIKENIDYIEESNNEIEEELVFEEPEEINDNIKILSNDKVVEEKLSSKLFIDGDEISFDF